MTTTSTPSGVASSSISVIPDILWRIGGCESGGGVHNPPRQFEKDGSVVRGKENPHDLGAWQINTDWNGEKAEELGFDLETYDGNLHMALWLYEHQGTKPWNWSRACWNQASK